MAAELYWRGRKNDHLVAQRKTQWRLAHKSSAGKARSSGYKNEKGRGMGQRHVRKSCVRFVVLAVSFSAVLSLAAQAATAPVGATPGSFSVDPNGGANYTIPIQISPGSAGMAPSIALTYSKQVDNPLVGVGFSISGLSIISRCGGTIALDGAKGGVYYDSRDRFCLDGQRLIAVNGADGAHNTEYRTERESFARIFSYDTSVCGLDNGAAPSSGPACFKVFSKDGTVSEYGVSLDSRIQAAPKNGVVQTTVRLWALNKVQDTRGNYYTIQYEENIPTEITGEYRPVRIDYTGNVSAGLLPYNSVRFVYGSRTDVVPHYEAGSVIKVTQRLTNIQTYTDATLVRSYNLAYDNNGAVGASRLTSITECGDDGVCLPGTKLMWELASVGFGNTDMGSPGIWNRDYTNIITGDFNGDGKMDFINQDGTWFQGLATLYLSNGDGTFNTIDMGSPGTWNRDYTNLIPGDFNGDGKMDFIKQNGTAWQGLAILYSNTPANKVSDFLTSVTNGLGATTTITHKPITDNTVYTKDPSVLSCAQPNPPPTNLAAADVNCYPYQNVQAATYVVSRVTQSDGVGGLRGTSYKYLGAKSHLTGPGWLGFRRMETTDELSSIVSITESDQRYEVGLNSMPTLLQTKLGARTLKQVQNFWQGVATTDPAYPAASQVRFAKLNGTLEQNFEPNLLAGSDLISCVSADNTFGSYGDITQTVARTDASCSFASAWVKTTTNSYCPGPEGVAVSNCPAPASRILGRLNRSQVTASASGVISQTRTSGFGYDSRGLLTSETIEPDEPASSTLRLATTHQYNEPYGNRTQSTVTGANPDATTFSRTTSFGYDSRGRYVESTTNALGHSSQATHDARWGTVLSQTDPNNVTVSFGYDGFGRKISETRPDGTTTSIAYAACDTLSNPCPSFGNGAVASYTVTTQSSGAAPATAYVDLLGRTLRTQTVGLTGATVYRDTEYDNQGRIARSTLPYFAGAT